MVKAIENMESKNIVSQDKSKTIRGMGVTSRYYTKK
jgi:hypothetical protein